LIELSGASAGATANGLRLTGTTYQIRGLAIFGFAVDGIYVDHTGNSATTIAGNVIGLRADGTTAAGNSNGIALVNSGATIGGASIADRNVISANVNGAITLSNSGSTLPTLVQGNYIGTDISGMLARHNDLGLSVGSAPGVQIIGNVISGNRVGVYVYNSSHPVIGGLYNSVIQGNTIGLDAVGGAAIANTIGILLNNANNLVGGTSAGQGNVISGNTAEGVLIGSDATVVGNRVRGNSIYNNGALGIDLTPGGVTANDAGDGDAGPNGLQNFPTLSLAFSTAAVTKVAGNLNSTPSTTFNIEVFSNPTCDPSGNGEGRQFAGVATVTTDGSGNAAFRFALGAYAGVGSFVTATATDPSGNTSEFSACRVVAANTPPTANSSSPSTNEDTDLPIVLAGADPEGEAVTFTLDSSPAHGTLSGTLPNLVYHPDADYNGSDSFTFRTSDGDLISSAATIAITVVAVNDNPVARDDSTAARLNTPVTVSVLANDTDVELDALTVTGVTNPAHGSASIGAGGTSVSYTPATDYTGPDTFDYTISDGHGGVSTAHVSVSVKHVGASADMAVARRLHTSTATSLSGNPAVLVAGGRGPCSSPCAAVTQGTAELYDFTTNSFAAAPINLVEARQEHVAVGLAGGDVLLAGGFSDVLGGNGVNLSSAEVYNQATGTMTATGSMAHTRADAAAARLDDGRVLVTGGYGDGSSTAEIYQPVSGSFAATGSMSVSRALHTATTLADGRVLIVGGYNGTSLGTAELFDPSGTGSFIPTGSLAAPRHGHIAVLLANGKVLIAGGVSCAAVCSGPLATAELFDPATGSFSDAGVMTQARMEFTATLLADGKVLLAGGRSGTSLASVTSTLEVYDPDTLTFTAVDGSLSGGRGEHAASLLPDGKVLITGGYSGTLNFVRTTDIYKQ
jgi:hypothetical protein